MRITINLNDRRRTDTYNTSGQLVSSVNSLTQITNTTPGVSIQVFENNTALPVVYNAGNFVATSAKVLDLTPVTITIDVRFQSTINPHYFDGSSWAGSGSVVKNYQWFVQYAAFGDDQNIVVDLNRIMLMLDLGAGVVNIDQQPLPFLRYHPIANLTTGEYRFIQTHVLTPEDVFPQLNIVESTTATPVTGFVYNPTKLTTLAVISGDLVSNAMVVDKITNFPLVEPSIDAEKPSDLNCILNHSSITITPQFKDSLTEYIKNTSTTYLVRRISIAWDLLKADKTTIAPTYQTIVSQNYSYPNNINPTNLAYTFTLPEGPGDYFVQARVLFEDVNANDLKEDIYYFPIEACNYFKIVQTDCGTFEVHNLSLTTLDLTVDVLSDGGFSSSGVIVVPLNQKHIINLPNDGVYKFEVKRTGGGPWQKQIFIADCQVTNCVKNLIQNILCDDPCCNDCREKDTVTLYNVLSLASLYYFMLHDEYTNEFIYTAIENTKLEELHTMKRTMQRILEYCDDCKTGVTIKSPCGCS
jgi:hypothetical protein